MNSPSTASPVSEEQLATWCADWAANGGMGILAKIHLQTLVTHLLSKKMSPGEIQRQLGLAAAGIGAMAGGVPSVAAALPMVEAKPPVEEKKQPVVEQAQAVVKEEQPAVEEAKQPEPQPAAVEESQRVPEEKPPGALPGFE